jgi:hypothetical protein
MTRLNRFQLVRKNRGGISSVKPISVAYRFKSSISINTVCSYMKKCIQEDVLFDSSNIDIGILDSAIRKILDEFKVPILVDDTNALIFSASYGIDHLCSFSNFDKNKSIIILWNLKSEDLSRLGVGPSNIFLRIIRNDN